LGKFILEEEKNIIAVGVIIKVNKKENLDLKKKK
jgi:hypothetical protein